MSQLNNSPSRLRRLSRLVAVSLLAAGLAACTSPFRADVSRFESRLPAPQGQSFAVVPDDPALAGGLEFAHYANYVGTAMRELGYTEAASPEAASLLVRFDYGIDTGRERVRSTGFRDPFFSPWMGWGGGGFRPMGWRGAGWRYGWHDPFFPGWGAGWGGGWGGWGGDVRSYTVFTSGIQMKIDDAASGERLFEGNAQALSTSNRLQYLVPNLVEAMFTDFPGNSGETVRISIAPDNQPVQRPRR